MIEEIIYTSAPRGLSPGSKGFCTVASTAGMANNLASLLESLSGYRHLAEPTTTAAAHNPVVFRHLKTRVGGRGLHILSRIADAGLDYSGRSNKIAHHVVLNSQTLPPGGPAALQSDIAFHETTWSGEPRLLTAERTLAPINAIPAVCTYWHEVTGDAGWGGVCAEALSQSEPTERWMICPVGVDVLRLLRESLAILPPAAQWNATYTTFYTKLPPGIECCFRCALDGTPEAQHLRKRYDLDALDLCQPLAQAPKNKWTEAASTGVLPIEKQVRSSVVTTPVLDTNSATDDSPYEVDLAQFSQASPPPLPSPRSAAPKVATVNRIRTRKSSSTGRREAWLLTLATTLILAICLGIFAMTVGPAKTWFAAIWADDGRIDKSVTSNESANAQDTEKRDADGRAAESNPEANGGEPDDNEALKDDATDNPKPVDGEYVKATSPQPKDKANDTDGHHEDDTGSSASQIDKLSPSQNGPRVDNRAASNNDDPFEQHRQLVDIEAQDARDAFQQLKSIPINLKDGITLLEEDRLRLQLLRPQSDNDIHQLTVKSDSRTLLYGSRKSVVAKLSLNAGAPQISFIMHKGASIRTLRFSRLRLIYVEPDGDEEYHCDIVFRKPSLLASLPTGADSASSNLLDHEHWNTIVNLGKLKSVTHLELRMIRKDSSSSSRRQEIGPKFPRTRRCIVAAELRDKSEQSIVRLLVAAQLLSSGDKVRIKGMIFNVRTREVIEFKKLSGWRTNMDQLSAEYTTNRNKIPDSFKAAQEVLNKAAEEVSKNEGESDASDIDIRRAMKQLERIKSNFNDVPEDLGVQQLIEWLQSISFDYQVTYGIVAEPGHDEFPRLPSTEFLVYGSTETDGEAIP